MYISIDKKILSESVYKVARFAERKSGALPALSSILILAADEGIKMRATNLETGIDLRLPGECKTTGVVAIPATILQQIAASLTGSGTMMLEQHGDLIALTTGTSKSLIKTVPYDDFPSIPFPENSHHTITLPGVLLKTLLSSLSSCASPSTIRPELASLYLNIEAGTLTIVATDSFRLVEKKVPLNSKGIQGTFLIPAKNAIEVAQALPDAEVKVSFDEHQCAFTSDEGVIVSRLTNATYPDYQQIIPKEFLSEAITLRKDFEIALKRTTIFSDSFQKVSLDFDSKKKALSLFAKNNDVGESSESLPAQVSGSSLTLSFNHRFLSSFFSLTQAESVSCAAVGIGRPLIMKGVGDNSLMYLVSPMNQ